MKKMEVFSKGNVYFFTSWFNARQERKRSEKFDADADIQQKIVEDIQFYLNRTKAPPHIAREALLVVIMQKLLITNPFRDPTTENVREMNKDLSFLYLAQERVAKMLGYYRDRFIQNGYDPFPWFDAFSDKEIAEMKAENDAARAAKADEET